MSAADSARVYYTSARTELIERIKLRDGVLVLYLAAVGALFGIAVGGGVEKQKLLLLLPFLAFGAAVIISQHTSVIGALASYCVTELAPFLRGLAPSEDAPQWDDSRALAQYQHAAVHLRTWGHGVMIIIPAVIALSFNWDNVSFSALNAFVIMWVAGVLMLVLAGFVIWRAHVTRTTLFSDTPWRSPPDT